MQIELDYSVQSRPRYGHGRPVHPGLHEILNRRRDDYARELHGVLEMQDALARIPARQPDGASAEPQWITPWLPGLDSAVLYAMVARRRPALYMEIGSGTSTTFVRRAIRDHALETRIVSIDPQPRAEIDVICDEVVRQPVEDVDLSTFDRLSAGDMLFVDNSHRIFMNSDATTVFLDVLPRLQPGVLVHFHDIFLPADYPPQWIDRYYSEQYVLAAYILAECPWLEVVLPNYFVTLDPELCGILAPLWSALDCDGLPTQGGSFWLAITRG
jgi:predicted O-methyltransferase YrrM